MLDAKGARKPSWEPKAFPPGTAHVLEWFLIINASRASTGFGVSPLSFVEIEAWARLSGLSLTPTEVILLRRFDAEFMEHMAGVSDLRAADAAANARPAGQGYAGRPQGAMPGR